MANHDMIKMLKKGKYSEIKTSKDGIQSKKGLKLLKGTSLKHFRIFKQNCVYSAFLIIVTKKCQKMSKNGKKNVKKCQK